MYSNKYKLIGASLSVILCWAYSPIGIRIGLSAYTPEHLALIRFVIASVFLMLLACRFKIMRLKLRDIPLLASLGFFAVTLHHLCLNMGQLTVSAGAASVLTQSTPIFSAVIAYFVLKEKITLWRWGCILLGMLGAIIVVLGDHGIGQFSPRSLLIFTAALSWSIYFVLQRKYSHQYTLLSMTCYVVWFGTLFLLGYADGLSDAFTQAPINVDIAVLILGIFPSALAYLAWAYVLKYVDVSRASSTLYLIPPTAMLMAAVILKEQTSIMVMLGGAVVLISVIALNMETTIRTTDNH